MKMIVVKKEVADQINGFEIEERTFIKPIQVNGDDIYIVDAIKSLQNHLEENNLEFEKRELTEYEFNTLRGY